MKNIVVIGASGFVGSAIVKEALNRDHMVIGVMRHPENLKIYHDHFTLRQADASNHDILAEICALAEVVISAFNPGWTNPNIYAETLMVYPAILKGVKQSGADRFLVVGGAGSLFVQPGIRLMDTGAIPEAYLPAVRGLAEFYENILSKETELDWVFFSPAGNIYPGERTGRYRLGKDTIITDEEGKSNISVEDYAMAMLDEVENPTHHRERFTIGY